MGLVKRKVNCQFNFYSRVSGDLQNLPRGLTAAELGRGNSGRIKIMKHGNLAEGRGRARRSSLINLHPKNSREGGESGQIGWETADSLLESASHTMMVQGDLGTRAGEAMERGSEEKGQEKEPMKVLGLNSLSETVGKKRRDSGRKKYISVQISHSAGLVLGGDCLPSETHSCLESARGKKHRNR